MALTRVQHPRHRPSFVFSFILTSLIPSAASIDHHFLVLKAVFSNLPLNIVQNFEYKNAPNMLRFEIQIKSDSQITQKKLLSLPPDDEPQQYSAVVQLPLVIQSTPRRLWQINELANPCSQPS